MKKLAVLTLLCLLLVGCSQKKSLKDNIVGTWVSVSKDGVPATETFNADGTGNVKGGIISAPFTWTIEDESHIRLHNEGITTTTLLKITFDGDNKMGETGDDGKTEWGQRVLNR